MTLPLGTLATEPIRARLDLVAAPVAAALSDLSGLDAAVAPIDASFADTAAFCAEYGVGLSQSANCVIVAGRRGEMERMAACVVLATTRADINGVVRRHLDVRKISFAPMDQATTLTSMEYGGITPIGLPADWPLLIDRRVVEAGPVVIGSGLRRSKVVIDGAALGQLGEVLDLAREAT